MKTLLYPTIIFALIFTACKKDEILLQEYELITPNNFHTPDKVGTYWIYQWYSIDSNGVETPYQNTDSVFVHGDTNINGKTYIFLEGTQLGGGYFSQLQRDSSGYIVNVNGDVIYSYTNFTDTIRQGQSPPDWKWRIKMKKENGLTLPAGKFDAIIAQEYYYSLSGGPANNCGDLYFTLGSWYVNGLGLVKRETGYTANLKNCLQKLECRLIDYHIEQ